MTGFDLLPRARDVLSRTRDTSTCSFTTFQLTLYTPTHYISGLITLKSMVS